MNQIRGMNQQQQRKDLVTGQNTLHMSFRNHQYPPNCLTAENVLEYFCNVANQFYDMSSCNQNLKMQNLPHPIEELLPTMQGVQFVVWSSQPPLFIICKQFRNSAKNVTPLAYYYVVNGLVLQAPDMYSFTQSKLLGAMEPLKVAFETVLSYSRYNAAKGYYWEFKSGRQVRNKDDQKEEEKPLESRSTHYQKTRTAKIIQQLLEEFPPGDALEIIPTARPDEEPVEGFTTAVNSTPSDTSNPNQPAGTDVVFAEPGPSRRA